ncbi:MAG: hypothetical protein M1839_004068 [Geoglossum umbratile]|nr:MAG: hypothetical protein M1839_004068 [Geoglossum umbratile]
MSTLTPSPPTQAPSKNRHRPLSRQRRRARSLLGKWIDLSFRHTWVNPLVVLLLVVSAYLINPTPENPVHHAIFLSYPLPPDPGADPSAPIRYGKGKLDIAFVAFYTVLLSFTREFLMQRLLKPVALYFDIKGRNKQNRFMEQAYTAIYFGFFGPFGLYVMSRTDMWYFNTKAFYHGFPHMDHDGLFKAYYLLEASYWAQQAIVLLLQLEKPRKDFKELVGHHIITLSLIALSYRFHFTHIGLAVYITHDISDFFLATSKTLNYLDSPIVGPYFGLFVFNWIYLRHYLNLTILWSILTEFRTIGPFVLNWETEQYKCLLSQVITFTLLASLQAVNLFWLFLILRIAKGYLFTSGLQDERSGDEESADEAPVRGNGTKGDGAVVANGEVLLTNGVGGCHKHTTPPFELKKDI